MSSTPSAHPAVKLTVTVIDGRVHPVVTSCMEPVVTSQVHDWPASCAAGGVRRVPGAVHAHPLGSAGGHSPVQRAAERCYEPGITAPDLLPSLRDIKRIHNHRCPAPARVLLDGHFARSSSACG